MQVHNTIGLQGVRLPAIREAKGDTIFNPANFLKIYDRLVQLRPDAHRQWGKMNVVQMLNHLKIATGSGIKLYKLRDESNFLWRTIIKFIALRFLPRFPKNARAAEGFKIEMNDQLDFDHEKHQALKVLQKAYASPYDSYLHPLFGKMSRAEWGILIYRHFDHHLRQFGY